MAAGFEGWLSIAEDSAYDTPAYNFPQMLYVDAETLTFEKEVLFHDSRVRNSHTDHASAAILKAAKPQGDVTFQFRSDDCLKILLAHFQCGTIQSETSPYRYAYYPRTNPLDYTYRGTTPNQAYGYTVARPYTVTVTKKLFNTTSYGGTNAFMFKGGVADKLSFQLTNNSDAKFKTHFFFRECEEGTAISGNPGEVGIGSYSSLPSFESWSGTVSMNGVGMEISSLVFESSHQTQEQSVVGHNGPESYQLSSYSLQGAFSFDLPYDALKEVGSMFSGGTFALTATLYNSTSDRMMIEIPCCVRGAFDFNFSKGDGQQTGQIPFRAFENNGTYPIKITVDTTLPIGALAMFGDALLGARSIPSSSWYDASASARSLPAYTYYNRN